MVFNANTGQYQFPSNLYEITLVCELLLLLMQSELKLHNYV